MNVKIIVNEGRGELPAPRPEGQSGTVHWAKLFLCLVALGTVMRGDASSIILVPAAMCCFTSTRQWLGKQWDNWMGFSSPRS